MFPGLARQDLICFPDMTAELVAIEMAAHGVTIVEIAQGEDGLAARARQRLQPPHQPGQHGDDGRWARGGPRADEDERRSVGPEHSRHAQQLRRRASRHGAPISPPRRISTAISGANAARKAARRRLASAARRPGAMSATACRACGRPGASSSTASMSTRNRTSRTVSAGSSRSIRSIRIRCR